MIVKHVNMTSILLGRSLTYTLTVRDSGPAAATGVTVADTPNAKLRLLLVKTTSGTCEKTLPVTCKLGLLAPGGRAEITILAVPLVAGEVVNHAHVTAAQTNTAPSDDVVSTARTEVLVPLKLTKTPSARTVQAGQSVRFAILIANPTAVTARQISVCDTLPAGLRFVSASVETHLHAGSLCWTVASIARHSRKAFTMTVRALTGAGGDLNNQVGIKGPAIETQHAHALVRVLRAPSRPTAVTG